MAKRKTTELTTITAAALADGDWFPVVDVSDTTDSSTGTNKKIAKSELAEAAGVTAHLSDAVDAHDASAISYNGSSNLSATEVEAALDELDAEKAAVAEPIAAAHIADTADAHDASAISVLDTAGNYTATDVEGALAEVPSRYGLPRKVVAPTITSYIERFQSGHGWTVLGSGAALTNDTTDFILGSQCASFETTTDGVARSVDKAGYSADSTGNQLTITFKITNTDDITSMFLFAGNTDFSSYYQWTICNDGDVDQQRWFKSNEWVTMTLNIADAAVIGTPTRTIQKLRVRVGASNGAAATTVRLGGIGLSPEPSEWPNGVLSICFDDIYASTWTKARAKMSQYGYPGTLYAISDRISSTYMTAAQLTALEAIGWDIAVHGNSALPGLGLAAAEADVLRERAALAAYGFRGVSHYAYPGGDYDVATMTMLKKYFTSARTIAYRSMETARPADPMRLRAWSVSNTTTTASINTLLTAIKANKGWAILVFHDIDDTAALGTQYSTTNFGTVMDNINTLGIPVRTVADVLSGVSA